MSVLLLARIYFYGAALLIAAIVLNLIAKIFKLATWYDFLTNVQASGVSTAFKTTSLESLIFLFIVYPLALGAVILFLTTR